MAGRPHRVISKGNPLGMGASQSLYLNVQAVAKANTPQVPYCIPNEMICSAIGQFLCLPLPPFGLAASSTSPTEIWFASLDFNIAGAGLPPVHPPDLVASLPSEATGLVLFDILIANSDRHAGNLSLDRLATPQQLTVFDHSHALLGHQPGQGVARLQTLRDRLAITGQPPTGGCRQCLLDIIPDDIHFREWTDRIKQLPDFLIDHVCNEMVDVGINQAEANAAKDFIKYRRDNFPGLLQGNRHEFRAINQWSLI